VFIQFNNQPWYIMMKKAKLFNYIVLSLLEKKIDSDRPNLSWANINGNNNFGKIKLSLLPFFVCIANGRETRTKLFHVFDKFVTNEYGIIEKEILELLSSEKSKSSGFSFNVLPHEDRLVLKDEVVETLSSEGVKLKEYLTFSPAEDDDLRAIDKSIDILQYRNEMKFYDFNHSRLSSDSQKHSIWEVYQYFIKKNEDQEHLINTNFLIDCKSIYSPENELFQISL